MFGGTPQNLSSMNNPNNRTSSASFFNRGFLNHGHPSRSIPLPSWFSTTTLTFSVIIDQHPNFIVLILPSFVFSSPKNASRTVNPDKDFPSFRHSLNIFFESRMVTAHTRKMIIGFQIRKRPIRVLTKSLLIWGIPSNIVNFIFRGNTQSQDFPVFNFRPKLIG